jgi:uncharacterized membrane protein YccC
MSEGAGLASRGGRNSLRITVHRGSNQARSRRTGCNELRLRQPHMIKAAVFRPIIFSVNCFIATILTLFIAFSLDLKSPGWAMTTVYLTSQPLSGVMRAKAFYRVIGTFVGGVAMVAIVPNFVNAPELTALAIILWVALCLYLSLLDRTPRSYVFALSGYTAALIGFPSVLAPEGVFDIAVSRVEEIAIGTICAAIVHSLIFPKSALSAFDDKLNSIMADARRWISDGLTKEPTPEIDRARRRVAADGTELYLLGTSLKFDTSPSPPDIGTIRAFDRSVISLLPLLTAVEDRLAVLRRMGPLPEKLAHVVSDIHDWVRDSGVQNTKVQDSKVQDSGVRGKDTQNKKYLQNIPEDGRGRAAELRQACVAVTPSVGPDSAWADLVTVNLTARLGELIASWQDCLDLATYIADPSRGPVAPPERIPASSAAKSMHKDPGVAFLSAVAAAVAMGVCCLFWIATAWPDGGGAVAFAAVLCTLFAVLDDPTPIIRNLTVFLALCIPLVAIYQFFIFPAIDGFTLLAVVLAIVLIPAGIALAIPRYAVVGLALVVGFSVELGLQSSYAADLATILNANSAFVVGGIVALVVTGLIRAIGVRESADRLVRAGLRDLANVSDRSVPSSRVEWVSRMLDRVGLLFYRGAGSQDGPKHEFADALADLRIGVNIIEIQEIEPRLTAAGRAAVETLLDGIAVHFRALAHDSVRPLGHKFLQQVDFLIGEIAGLGDNFHSGVASIVGLRRSLYPDAPPYGASP